MESEDGKASRKVIYRKDGNSSRKVKTESEDGK